MGYKSLNKCLADLDSNNELKKVHKESDTNLEMAYIHLDEF